VLTRRQALGAPALALAPKPRPNLILLVSDDHGYHDLGCQGASDLKTPHLDRLAASGARLTHWYANAPVCAPSRASILTGRYPIRAGVPTNGPDLPASELTIARVLKSAGYRTACFGKWHLGSTDRTSPNGHGFDSFFGFHSGCVDYYSHRFYWGEPGKVNEHDLWRNRREVFEDGRYLTELIAAEAEQFIAASSADPFFLYVPFNAVHYPMHAPAKYLERFPDLEPERRMYAAMLAAMDDAVGRIQAAVARRGASANTLVFFQGDNGATREPRAGLYQEPAHGGSNAPLRGFKFSLFEGGIRVPALVSFPGRIPPRQVIHSPGAAIDLLPTFCAAAGVAPPSDRVIDGRDEMPSWSSGAPSPHDSLFWAFDGQLAVRQGRWKLVANGYVADGTRQNRERLKDQDSLFLSDLEADPGETNNLRRAEPARAAALERAARKWLEDVKN
jgi:arylsulfatase A-like enzyme